MNEILLKVKFFLSIPFICLGVILFGFLLMFLVIILAGGDLMDLVKLKMKQRKKRLEKNEF